MHMGINIYYFFASIYGWIRWNRSESKGILLPSSIHHDDRFCPHAGHDIALLAIYLLIITDSPAAG